MDDQGTPGQAQTQKAQNGFGWLIVTVLNLFVVFFMKLS